MHSKDEEVIGQYRLREAYCSLALHQESTRGQSKLESHRVMFVYTFNDGCAVAGDTMPDKICIAQSLS